MGSESNPEIVGRYAVFGPIASGGMATVHLGRLVGPRGFSRTVAIKRMRPTFLVDSGFVTMFADEARVAGRIRHPNVVPVIDVVSTERELLLVMEYVSGESLARLTRLARDASQRIPLPIACAIVRDALLGLHAAHETKDERGATLNIVHRDVSPQNILVGADGVARVLDFGIAKAAGRSQVTREGEIKGKLAYMAPEQISGEVTRATDLFACSTILWEALTGQRLFLGATDAETAMRVLAGEVQKPSALAPEISPELDAIVLKGLARTPTDRYASAREMALDLGRAVALPDPVAIGEWVTSIAGPFLREKERIVTETESFIRPITTAKAFAPVPLVAPPPAPSSRSPLRPWWLVAVAVGVLSVVAGAFVLGRRGSSAAPAPVSSEAAVTSVAATTPSAPISAEPEPAPIAPVASSPMASAAKTGHPRPPSPSDRAKLPAAPRIPDHL